jgi:hypothetical protein
MKITRVEPIPVRTPLDKLVEVSGGYGERVTPARQMLPALERAMKAVLVEKRQALLNVVCEVDTNAGGD